MRLVRFAEQFFWTALWLVLILIVVSFALNYARNNWPDSLPGKVANWTAGHMEP